MLQHILLATPDYTLICNIFLINLNLMKVPAKLEGKTPPTVYMYIFAFATLCISILPHLLFISALCFLEGVLNLAWCCRFMVHTEIWNKAGVK